MNLGKPSTKIDLAVAEAVGIGAAMLADQCCYCDTSDPNHDDFRPSPSNPNGAEVFAPSREWNHAMDAVKAFLHKYPNVIEQQLFMSRIRRIVCSEDREATWQWVFFLLVKAGPLALCAAILKTPKGNPDADEND